MTSPISHSGVIYKKYNYVIKFVSDLSIIFSVYSGFLHTYNWLPQYNWHTFSLVSQLAPILHIVIMNVSTFKTVVILYIDINIIILENVIYQNWDCLMTLWYTYRLYCYVILYNNKWKTTKTTLSKQFQNPVVNYRYKGKIDVLTNIWPLSILAWYMPFNNKWRG